MTVLDRVMRVIYHKTLLILFSESRSSLKDGKLLPVERLFNVIYLVSTKRFKGQVSGKLVKAFGMNECLIEWM